jgi:hypothetical protein
MGLRGYCLGLVVAAAGVSMGVGVAIAGPQPACGSPYPCAQPDGSTGGGSSTQAFLGLRWDFGAQGPALTGGVRYLKSDDGDTVYGAQFDGSLPLTGDSHLPKLRLLGVFGSEAVQGQIGGGYDFGKQTAIVSGGLQGPYIEGGIDYGLDGSVAPYVGLNSLKKPDIADGLSCPDPYSLLPVTNGTVDFDSSEVLVDPSYIAEGQTCIWAGST